MVESIKLARMAAGWAEGLMLLSAAVFVEYSLFDPPAAEYSPFDHETAAEHYLPHTMDDYNAELTDVEDAAQTGPAVAVLTAGSPPSAAIDTSSVADNSAIADPNTNDNLYTELSNAYDNLPVPVTRAQPDPVPAPAPVIPTNLKRKCRALAVGSKKLSKKQEAKTEEEDTRTRWLNGLKPGDGVQAVHEKSSHPRKTERWYDGKILSVHRNRPTLEFDVKYADDEEESNVLAKWVRPPRARLLLEEPTPRAARAAWRDICGVSKSHLDRWFS